MEILYFLGGVIVGTIVTIIFRSNTKTYGVIRVDHNIEACFIEMNSKELTDRKIKKAVFDVDHNANLSREEQGL